MLSPVHLYKLSGFYVWKDQGIEPELGTTIEVKISWKI